MLGARLGIDPANPPAKDGNGDGKDARWRRRRVPSTIGVAERSGSAGVTEGDCDGDERQAIGDGHGDVGRH